MFVKNQFKTQFNVGLNDLKNASNGKYNSLSFSIQTALCYGTIKSERLLYCASYRSSFTSSVLFHKRHQTGQHLFVLRESVRFVPKATGGGNSGRGSVPRSHSITVNDSLSWARSFAFSASNSGRLRRASAMIPLSSYGANTLRSTSLCTSRISAFCSQRQNSGRLLPVYYQHKKAHSRHRDSLSLCAIGY